MTRDFSTSVTSAVAAVQNQPVELYEVYLDSGTLRFAQTEQDLTFAGNLYTALAATRAPVRTSAELVVDEVEIRLDNVNLAFSQRVVATDFIGRRLIVKKVFRDYLVNSGDHIVVFDGRMDEPFVDQKQFTVKVRSWLDALHQYVPRRVYSTMCNYQLYDAFCTVSKTLGTNIATGTAIGSSTVTVVVGAVLSGFADDYWGPVGTLRFATGSNAAVGREMIHSSQSSNSAAVRVGFPFAPLSGDVFSLTRGCRKTVADCTGKFNNFANYGGFHTIPKMPLV